MINHTRTLLMNRGRDGYDRDFPGEEYVVPNYRARQLPLHLQLAFQTLFGITPDRLFLNYRMWQLMNLLHSTELEEFVLAKDPRITYWPMQRLHLFNGVFTTTASGVNHGHELMITGEHVANEGAGHARQQWQVRVVDGDTVQVTRRTPPPTMENHAYTINADLSNTISLNGSGLVVRFRSVPAGTTWIVTSHARPQTDVGEILARLEHSFGEHGVSSVFGALPTEPVKTFKSIWDKHNLSTYRYSALLLAMVEQLDLLPQEDA